MKTQLSAKQRLVLSWLPLLVSAAIVAFLAWWTLQFAYWVSYYIWNFNNQAMHLTGGALDQPSLHKHLFLSYYFFFGCGLPLMLVRWLNRNRQSNVRLFYAGVSILLLWLSVFCFTVFCIEMLHYILAMGLTWARVTGLGVGIANLLLLAFFGAWLAGVPWRQFKEAPRLRPFFVFAVIYPPLAFCIYMLFNMARITVSSLAWWEWLLALLFFFIAVAVPVFFIKWLFSKQSSSPTYDQRLQNP